MRFECGKKHIKELKILHELKAKTYLSKPTFHLKRQGKVGQLRYK